MPGQIESFLAQFEAPSSGAVPQASETIDSFLAGFEPSTPKSVGIMGTILRGYRQGIAGMSATGAGFYGLDPTTAGEIIAKNQREILANPASPAVQRFFTEQSWESFADAPLEITATIIGESLGTFGPTLGAGAVTSLVAPAALPAIVGTGSFAIEAGGKILDSMREAGVDLTDAQSLKAAFEDEGRMKAVKKLAVRKGVPIGLFDAASMGIAGRLFGPIAKTFGRIAGATGEVGAQAALGAVGETAGELVAGEELQPAQIAAEALGELGMGPAEIATAVLTRKPPVVPPPPPITAPPPTEPPPGGAAPLPEPMPVPMPVAPAPSAGPVAPAPIVAVEPEAQRPPAPMAPVAAIGGVEPGVLPTPAAIPGAPAPPEVPPVAVPTREIAPAPTAGAAPVSEMPPAGPPIAPPPPTRVSEAPAAPAGAVPTVPTVPVPPVAPAPLPKGQPIARRDIKPDVALTTAGREVPVSYAVVEADSLIASSLDDGSDNPIYPQAIQPRDRDRPASQQQVNEIAQKLDPRLVAESALASDGAPIIAPDGIVESGNARIMGIRRAYAEGTERAENYREYLGKRGFPVEDMKAPILVRVRTAEMEDADRIQFVREANQPSTAEMSETEVAMGDARALRDEDVRLYRGGDIDSTENRAFLRSFMERAVASTERGPMISATGEVTPKAIRRGQSALLAKAYQDPLLVAALVEATDNNIKAIGGAMLDVAPQWASMRAAARAGQIASEVDASERLMEAARLVNTARREGNPIGDYVKQTDIFKGRAVHPVAEMFLRLFFRDNANWKGPVGRGRIAAALRYYVDQAMQTKPGVDLLGGQAPTPETLLAKTKEEQERSYAEGPETGELFRPKPTGAGQPDVGVRRDEGAAEGVQEPAPELRPEAPRAREEGAPAPEAVKPPSAAPSPTKEPAPGAEPTEEPEPKYRKEPGAEAAKPAALDAVREVLQRIAPAAKLEIVKHIFAPGGERARGVAAGNIVRVALHAGDPEATVRHEGLHALRNMGLFTDEEWTVLERRAGKWRAKHEIDDAYAGADEETKNEEGIAHAYEDMDAWAAEPPGIRRIFARIARFFRQLGNVLRGLGFQTWEDVFERIERGEVGMREAEPTVKEVEAFALTREADARAEARQLTRETGLEHFVRKSQGGWSVMTTFTPSETIGGRPSEAAKARRQAIFDVGKAAPLPFNEPIPFLAAAEEEKFALRSGTPDEYRALLESQRELEGLRAAMRDPQTGKIYTGVTHQAAIDGVPKDDKTGTWARLQSEWDRATTNAGFVDRRGRFISRDEAEKRWNVLTMEDIRRPREKFALWPRRHATPRSQLERDLATVSYLPERKSVFEHIWQTLSEWRAAREDIVNEAIRGMLDAFHPMKVVETRLHGDVLDASVSAWKMMQKTRNLDNVMATVMGVAIKGGRVVGGPLRYNAKEGRVENRTDIPPLSEIFRPLAEMGEGALNAWKAWVIARRAKVLMAEGRENNVSQEFIDRYEHIDREHTKAGRNVFKEAFDGWRKFNGAMLDFAEQAGTINAQQRALWDDAFYVPFYRIIEEETVGPMLRKGVANQTSGIRRLTGSEKPIGDVIENIVLNTTKLVDSSFKTIAMSRAVPMLLQSGSIVEVTSQIEWKMVHTPIPQISKVLKEQAGIDLGKLTKDQREQWLHVFAMAPPRGKDIVFFMDKGKRRYFQVRDPSMLQALTALHPEQMHAILRMLGWVKGGFTTWVTHDPAFMIANAMRDSLHAWVISHGRIRFGAGPAKGFRQALAGSPELIEIMAMGAATGGFYRNSAMRRSIEAPAHKKTVLGLSKDALHAYEKLGFASEYANRLARYEGGIGRGETKAEAAFQAMDLLNFSMHGGWQAMRWLTTTVPFMNARVQGLYRLGRAYHEDPKVFLAHAATLTLATMALYFANKDDDRYKDLPNWDKDLYYHFFLDNLLPAAALEAAGVPREMWHLRLPKPFEIGAIFSTLPEHMALLLGGTDRTKDVLNSVQRILLDIFAFNPIPQAFKPLAEEAMNLNFFTGRPIVGMTLEGVRPEAQYEPSTSETARLLAKAVPEWAGAAGSPVRLEHLVRGYFGAVGMYILGAADIATRGIVTEGEEPTRRWDQIPVVQRFMRQEPAFTTKWVGEFYDMRREVEAVYRTMQKYKREGDMDAYKALRLDKRDELRLRDRLNRAYDHMRNIDRRIERVTLSKTMDGDRKRELIDKYLEQKQRLAKRYANIRIERSSSEEE